MKRILLALCTVVALAACNNDAASEGDVKDSVLEKIDSVGDARVDSVQKATDSLENKVENSFEKTDSANKANAKSAEGEKF